MSSLDKTLAQTIGYLEGCLGRADQLLAEADAIGLWSRSDDSSDNRRKRTLLREADWALADGSRRINDALSEREAGNTTLHALRQIVGSLSSVLESLPDLVADTDLTNPELSARIGSARAEISSFQERLRILSQSDH